jgi:hypothetical protein
VCSIHISTVEARPERRFSPLHVEPEEVIMDRIVRFIGAAALLLGFALHTISGHACTATTPDVFSVGNKTADASCTYGTIQAAINAATCAAGTKIILNSSGDYTNQNLSITNKNITLIGRANTPSCSTAMAVCGTFFPCPTAPLRTIHGNIKIRGTSNVTIQYLEITGGHGAADSNGHTWGGGIDYAASGRLDIDTSTIDYNTANDGGGIRFQGYGGAADLYLHSNTLITNNTATSGGSGGGLRVEGDSTLHADEPNTWISYNKAADKGGGIIVIGPAAAHIGSIGLGGLGVITDNTANYGGGIAAYAASTDFAYINVFATDPNHPVRIERNRAYQAGGGIYLGAYITSVFGDIGGGIATLGGAQINDNAAQEGSGIYADTDSSSRGSAGGFIEFAASYCAVGSECNPRLYYCAPGVECNTASNNRAVATDSQGHETPTAGSTILLQTYASLTVDQLAMRGNQGAHVIRVADSLFKGLLLNNCLIASNATTAELMTFGNASASVNQCTIAGNSIGGTSVLYAETGFSMTNSIIEQGTLPAVHYVGSGDGITLDYLLLSPNAPIPSFGATHIVKADAQFVNTGSGDFHLAPNSPAVDVAPPETGDDRDLENRPRDQDLPEVPNINGDRDLGAYERQLSACDVGDTIFCNGFDGP